MATPPEFALEHYAAQADLAAAAAQVAGDMWSEVDPRNMAESWAAQVPEMEAVLSGAQLASARLAEPYVEEAAAFADAVEDVAEKLAPRAFAGVASDGRALASLLYQPAITSLLAIKSGHDLRTALASGRATLDMITRTQVADAGRSAVQVGMTPRKELDGYIRVAVGKSCSRCVILAGKFYRYNSGFDRHPNCFPGGIVVSGPELSAATRRWYEGELVFLATASGKDLALTGNHPVLTSRGWVPANLVQEGDEVVGSTRPEGAAPLVVPDHHQVPALIEDVWRALCMAGFDRVPSTPEDFHGDGQHGEVDVVYADRTLRGVPDFSLVEQTGEPVLTLRRELALALHQQSVAELVDPGNAAHACGHVRAGGLSFTLGGSHLRGADPTRLARATSLNSMSREAALDDVAAHAILAAERVFAGASQIGSSDGLYRQDLLAPRWDAPPAKFSIESRAAYVERGQDLLNRLVGQVELDRIVVVQRKRWAGHVYSLTSVEGWHTANSLIVSNCDCVHLPSKKAQAANIDQDPQVIYNSLTPKERSQAGWSYADQKAIAEGADLNQVTNIRRKGALFVADGKQYTREGAKTRAKQGIKEPRKTPGQIYREAGDDRDEAVRLLREHGYLFGPAKTAPAPAVDLQRKAVARQATIDTARARAQLLAEIEEVAVINEANGPELARMAAAAAKRFGVEDDPELAKLLQRAASGDAAMVEAIIESLGAKLGLTRIGGNLQTTQIVKFDKRLHDMLPGEKPTPWVEIVRPGYELDLDGEQLVLTKAVAAESDLRPMPVHAARARKLLEGQKALDAAPVSITDRGLTKSEADTLRSYKGTGSSNLNTVLRFRRGKPMPKSWEWQAYPGWVRDIDAVQQRSALAADVRAYKGIAAGERIFGKAWGKNLGGAEWTEYGYQSMSTLREVAETFVKDDGALLILRVPKGTGAIRLSGTDYEAEILGQRNLRHRVISDTGPGPNRVIEVEIAPAGTTVQPLDKPLDKMTVPQLRDLAKQRGTKIPSGARKADIVRLLDAAPAAAVEDLSKKTIAQLRELAKDRGVKVLAKDRKADLIAKLEPAKPDASGEAAAHLAKLTANLPQRIQTSVNEAMKLQGALVPKTSLRLGEIVAPAGGELGEDFHNLQGLFAYYKPATRQLVINPAWATDDLRGLGIEDAQSLATSVRSCQASGWFSHSGGVDELGSMCSHEFGHHVSAAFVKVDPKTGEETLAAAQAKQLFPLLDKALGTSSGKLGQTTRKVSAQALDDWMTRNRTILAVEVSEYGTDDFHELLAEIWREYSTMGDLARPGIREVGRTMRELAEAAS